MSAEPRKKHSLDRTLKTRAVSNGLAAPVATPKAPDLAGARMGRSATDRAAFAAENPAGARVWAGGADGCADVCYHHCLGEGDGTRRPAQERQAGRAAGCLAGGEGTRADGMGIGNPKRGRAGCQIRSPAARPGASSPIPPESGQIPRDWSVELWVGGWWVQHRRRKGQPAPKRGRAGRSCAGASASANAGVHAGVNAGHTMRDACGPHNAGRVQTCERTGRWERGRSSGHGTPDHTDTVKARTQLQRVMPSASLVSSRRYKVLTPR